MCKEIPLTGGRVTQGVMRAGDTVLRPCGAHSAFVHSVLIHLKNTGLAPEYLGQDASGREILSFLPGFVPDNIGFFTDEQCACAARIIHSLHEALSDFPETPEGKTVCHGDLSPCNFVFTAENGLPCAVIDWDACRFGDTMDDIAYALWMWLDIGSDEQDAACVRRRITLMLSACGVQNCPDIKTRILSQMHRVAESIFPTPEQTAATRAWALSCAAWTEKNL